ncbi:P-loop containing nucleoside triphosphate hydrolase [Pseudocohnilembus persalinus]|uniref:p-loop containing nucleoside triphosphate hydrolase n=1 Tax=Pseudocohnilembus persalinus TaxID=266149 RepID=A0A0V0QL99_PSEPJ|nr:P-loop containing nucleoside triphosphate hydrolase [Pseudocohnilembus persalinus]|eukprot:KRX02833.1 P-loop containing nucleoside triphosphate hydrolase [Pseudocohnilembus persalinus]
MEQIDENQIPKESQQSKYKIQQQPLNECEEFADYIVTSMQICENNNFVLFEQKEGEKPLDLRHCIMVFFFEKNDEKKWVVGEVGDIGEGPQIMFYLMDIPENSKDFGIVNNKLFFPNRDDIKLKEIIDHVNKNLAGKYYLLVRDNCYTLAHLVGQKFCQDYKGEAMKWCNDTILRTGKISVVKTGHIIYNGGKKLAEQGFIEGKKLVENAPELLNQGLKTGKSISHSPTLKINQPQQQNLNFSISFYFGSKKSKNLKNQFHRKKATKEVLDYSKNLNYEEKQQEALEKQNVKCLVLHPVGYPNKGAEIELYLAEEAIGLTKSLGWGVSKGPYWQEEFTENIQKQFDEKQKISDRKRREEWLREEAVLKGLSNEQYKELYEKEFGQDDQDVESKQDESEWKQLAKSDVKDGDYIYTPAFKGVYYNGGLVVDLSSSDESDGDMFSEWGNELLRQSFAKSCLIRVRKVSSKNYLNRGKLHEIGTFIKNNDINAVYFNTELSTIQNRNLEKYLLQVVNGKEDEKFFNKSSIAYRNGGHSSDSELSDSQIDPQHHENYVQQFDRKLRVFDRYTMILQIFAKRARTQLAKLQIEYTFLNFLRTKLMREGGNTFSYMYNIFQGDLMQAEQVNLEVVSAKSRLSKGIMTGGGETQLELQRRLIGEKQAEIQGKIKKLQSNAEFARKRKQAQLSSVPVIALIGYTNAGKSALMNSIIKQEVVESKDLLFQTLSTTSRKIRLISGQQAILLDTIGFVSNLPHDLVESFKTTLQEVEYADLVLHVRDISHPQTEEQKKTVLKVLKQLNFDQEFYTKKMVEVWNKIDLIKNEVDYENASVQDYPIVPISAKYKTNVDKLIETVEGKVNFIQGKRKYKLIHGIEKHGERTKWLFQNANITKIENEKYDYTNVTKEFPYGTVTIEIILDDIQYRRYGLNFGIKDQRELDDQYQSPKKKGMPPPEW